MAEFTGAALTCVQCNLTFENRKQIYNHRQDIHADESFRKGRPSKADNQKTRPVYKKIKKSSDLFGDRYTSLALKNQNGTIRCFNQFENDFVMQHAVFAQENRPNLAQEADYDTDEENVYGAKSSMHAQLLEAINDHIYATESDAA